MNGPDNWKTAYIGLGSNLNDPLSQLRLALKNIGQLHHCVIQGLSRLYESKPLGPQDQGNFLNAAVKLSTAMAPLTLLTALQRIEQIHQRKNIQHWGPRTLDLDLLLYENIQMSSQQLTLPHPGLLKRNFVLQPLIDITPNLMSADGRSMQQVLSCLNCPPLRQLKSGLMEKC